MILRFITAARSVCRDDYSQPGSYYVTICTEAKEHLFGRIVEGDRHRNELGDYAALCWEWLARQYPYVDLDEWIIMPNHLHGIIVITDRPGSETTGGGSRTAPNNTTEPPLPFFRVSIPAQRLRPDVFADFVQLIVIAHDVVVKSPVATRDRPGFRAFR